MTPRVRFTAAAVPLLCATVAGCGTSDRGAPASALTSDSNQVSVDVSTAELRELKTRAGIEDCPETSGTDTVSEGLPDITLPCLGGGAEVSLTALRGVPLVLNLWASWCGPCRDELPLFQRLHEATDSRLVVVGVDIDDQQPAKALALAAETGVTYPLLADPDAALRVPLRVMALPQTVFVAANGRVVAVERRVMTSYEQLRSLVRDHLGVTG